MSRIAIDEKVVKTAPAVNCKDSTRESSMPLLDRGEYRIVLRKIASVCMELRAQLLTQHSVDGVHQHQRRQSQEDEASEALSLQALSACCMRLQHHIL